MYAPTIFSLYHHMIIIIFIIIMIIMITLRNYRILRARLYWMLILSSFSASKH